MNFDPKNVEENFRNIYLSTIYDKVAAFLDDA